MRHTPCGYCPPYPRRSGLPSPPGKVSAKQTDAGRGAVAMHRCNLRFSVAPCRGGRLCAAVSDEGALRMRHTPCGYCPPASSGFLRTQRNVFLNPFFSFSARKKRTGSISQEKKEGTVPTVVLNLTQKISDFLCPPRQSLPPERSLRIAFRRHLLCDSNTAPVGADDPVRPYRTMISPQTPANHLCLLPGGQYPQGVCRIRKAPSSLTAAQSRPPLHPTVLLF